MNSEVTMKSSSSEGEVDQSVGKDVKEGSVDDKAEGVVEGEAISNEKVPNEEKPDSGGDSQTNEETMVIEKVETTVENDDNVTKENSQDENGSGEDKYSREDASRRVLVKHVDRKKTADDIEDYMFDNYPDCGLEDIFLVYNTKSSKKVFYGDVILTFETVQKAKDFLAIKLKNESTLTYRKKLARHNLEDVHKRREGAARASMASDIDNKTSSSNGFDASCSSSSKAASVTTNNDSHTDGVQTGPKSKSIVCVNFPTTYDSYMEVQRYLRECHENVREVRRLGPKTLVTFKDQRSADRFLGLTYVKFKGCYIMRSYYQEEQKSGSRQGEKRKLDQRNSHSSSSSSLNRVTPSKSDLSGQKKPVVQFKLKGIFSEGTNYQEIKSVLENEHGLDVRFVTVVNGEARVKLLAGSDTAAEVVYRLAKDQVTVNGEVLVPASLTKEEEAGSKRGTVGGRLGHRAKREKLSDWSDY